MQVCDLAPRAARPGMKFDLRLDEQGGPAPLENRGSGGELVGAIGGEDLEEGVDALSWGFGS